MVVMRASAFATEALKRIANANANERTSDVGERGMVEDIAWARHAGAHATCVDVSRGDGRYNARLAAVVARELEANAHVKIWARVKVGGVRDDDAYVAWRAFAKACANADVRAAIEIGRDGVSEEGWRRWRGERVVAFVLRVDAFRTNAKGYPVLPRTTQALAKEMFRLGAQVILSDRDDDGDELACVAPWDVDSDVKENEDGEGNRTRLYWEYLAYLFRGVEASSEQALAEAPYRDYLQIPLQPLMDNLENVTYETFEKDASKYNQYEEAVRMALVDGARQGDEAAVVMVVGAGRGPLVNAALRAAKSAHRDITVYAIEKNPHAVVTLQHLAQSDEWRGRVRVCPGDMRACDVGDVKADIIVSELLGSFGDNELSPECLDGAMSMLKDGGVSIPSEYESFIAPITAAKLHASAAAYKDLEHMETPYVVRFHRVHEIAEPKSAWKFSHPRKQQPSNERQVDLEFETTQPVTVHGFAGYFDALLYAGNSGTVRCSIHPHNHTMGPTGEPMFSWFPLYFPIREPVLAVAGDRVTLHLWRRVDAHKMWYEWLVSSPVQGPLHNINGRSYRIGL